MDRFLQPLAAALVVSALLSACAGFGSHRGGDEAESRRAALARLVVDNRTQHRLDIVVRYAVGAGGEVMLGRVPAGAVREMAPMPAGEPVILLARSARFERRLPPRSFEIGQTWHWVIQPDSTSHD